LAYNKHVLCKIAVYVCHTSGLCDFAFILARLKSQRTEKR